MSLITQCPACSTMFRVVPDQLRISEGWVRCGQCDEVFDANAHLRSLEEHALVPSPEPQAGDTDVAAPPPVTADSRQGDEAISQGYDWGPVLKPRAEQSEMPAVETQDVARNIPQEAQEPTWEGPLTGSTEPAPDLETPDAILYSPPSELPVSAESQDPHFLPTTVEDWIQESPAPQENIPDPVSISKEDAAPSFMRRRHKRTRVASRLGRKVMLSASVVLAPLLAFQFLYLERDRLAASVPALHSPLVSACEYLGCTVSAPRQIESIAIENSAFTHVKSGIYNLSLSLRNGAAIDLATPALELTLTDMQDQVLVRRVLLPGEYSANASIASRAELAAMVPIAIRAGVATEKISGYKLLAFYP